PPEMLTATARREVLALDSELPIYEMRTMTSLRAGSTAPQRCNMRLLGTSAGPALALAVVGAYGVLAYAVTQRQREIGVRMALGAQRRDVLRLVVTRALRIIAAGLIVGLAGAAGVTRVLQAFLFGVTPTDPSAFTVVTLLLMAVGLMAAWLPARRA